MRVEFEGPETLFFSLEIGGGLFNVAKAGIVIKRPKDDTFPASRNCHPALLVDDAGACNGCAVRPR